MTFASSWPIMRMERAGYEGISTDHTRGVWDRQGNRVFPWGLLRAGLLLREELEGIEEPAVRHHLVVEVRAGRAAGASELADQLTALHMVAGVDHECGEVTVAGLEPEPVVEDDQVAVATGVARLRHNTCGSRVNRLALLAGDIEAGMVVGVAGQRVHARTHCGCEPPLGWPDRRRRGRQRIPLFNVGSDRLQPRFEALEQRAKEPEGIVGIR